MEKSSFVVTCNSEVVAHFFRKIKCLANTNQCYDGVKPIAVLNCMIWAENNSLYILEIFLG